jgi:hypothetical protein
MNLLAPEEIELNKKLAVLERLKDRLATREEEMADLRADLEQFEANYTMEVGRLYADLDDIEAQIAEEEVRIHPEDDEIRRKADEARRRAEESAAQAEAEDWENCSFRWQPTIEAKKAYHKLARLIHPDLALDDEERGRRHELMAKLNDAYSAGDQNQMNELVEEYRDSPDLIAGDSLGDRLIRVIRQISQVHERPVRAIEPVAFGAWYDKDDSLDAERGARTKHPSEEVIGILEVFEHMGHHERRVGIGRDYPGQRLFGGGIVEDRVQTGPACIVDEMRIHFEPE